MKISKSKQELARIISENGEWRDGAESAAQSSSDNAVSFYLDTASRFCDRWYGKHMIDGDIEQDGLISNWHQTVLSRTEYLHLYPAPDADGWIEWCGGECPVGDDSIVDVMFGNGRVGIGLSPLPAGGAGREGWRLINGRSDIIAYRLHKPEQAGATDKLSSEAVSAAKIALMSDSIEELVRKPTIEQLAADYRSAKDYAERKQQEADAYKADADDMLKELELAGEAIGLLVSPITAKQEQELSITDWRDLRVGDVIEVTGSSNEGWQKVKGKELTIKIVRSDGASTGEWLVRGNTEFRLIRRP